MKFRMVPKKISVFDFDDTLATTGAKIKVTNKNLALSTSEFAKYEPESDDLFDFSDFRTGKLVDPQPTRFFQTAFLRIISGGSDIMILTARPNTDEIKNFLSDYIDSSRLIMVGGAQTPELKKQEIEKMLDKYEDIRFYDDSIPNIMAVRSIGSPKIKTQIVKK